MAPQAPAATGSAPIVADSSEIARIDAPDWQARQPLVVIPVTLTRIDFETPLSQAIGEALARRPDLALDLVAVAPVLNSRKDQELVDEIARASAGEVRLALSRLGLVGDRVAQFSASDAQAATPEIRIYPRANF